MTYMYYVDQICRVFYSSTIQLMNSPDPAGSSEFGTCSASSLESDESPSI